MELNKSIKPYTTQINPASYWVKLTNKLETNKGEGASLATTSQKTPNCKGHYLFYILMYKSLIS
jgi:hypothetical protein